MRDGSTPAREQGRIAVCLIVPNSLLRLRRMTIRQDLPLPSSLAPACSLFDRDRARTVAESAALARFEVLSTDGEVALCRDHSGGLVCLGKLDDGQTYLTAL